MRLAQASHRSVFCALQPTHERGKTRSRKKSVSFFVALSMLACRKGVFDDGKRDGFDIGFFEEFFGDGALREVLDIPSDQSGSLIGSRAFFRDEVDDIGAEPQRDGSFRKPLLEGLEFEFDDVSHAGLVDRSEYDDVIEAVEEFWPHLSFQFVQDIFLDGFELGVTVFAAG